jgi:hypothetical protein
MCGLWGVRQRQPDDINVLRRLLATATARRQIAIQLSLAAKVSSVATFLKYKVLNCLYCSVYGGESLEFHSSYKYTS